MKVAQPARAAERRLGPIDIHASHDSVCVIPEVPCISLWRLEEGKRNGLSDAQWRRPAKLPLDKVVEEIQQYGGTVLRSSLSHEDEATLQAALSQVLCVNGLHESVAEVADFPDGRVETSADGEHVRVRGLDEALLRCHDAWRLPSELPDVSWGRAGRPVHLPFPLL